MLGDGADDDLGDRDGGFGRRDGYRSRSPRGGGGSRSRSRSRSRGAKRDFPRSWSRSRSRSPRRRRRGSRSRSRSRSRSGGGRGYARDDRRRGRRRSRSASGSPRGARAREVPPPPPRDGGRHRGDPRDSQAPQPTAGRGPGVCYAFQRGRCTRGDECRFAHVISDVPPPPPGARSGGNRGGDASAATLHPPLHSIQKGRVATVRPFGLFVRMNGFVRDGLVHCANVSDELTFRREDGDDAKVMAMEYFHPRDSEVFAKVVEIRRDGYSGDVKVGLSMKLVDQSSGEDLDPDHSRAKALLEGGFGGNGNGNGHGNGDGDGHRDPRNLSDDPPALNSTHRAVVKEVKPYGVFVSMAGFRRNGLVPHHQVSDYLEFSREDTDEDKVKALEGAVGKGDEAWVKVVELKEPNYPGEGPVKVTCSIKLCDQRDGSDLDPGCSRYFPQGERGGDRDGVGGNIPRRVGDGAGEAVKRGGVIDWGHHLGDVKQYGDGGRYDLVTDDVGEGLAQREDGQTRVPQGRPGHGPPRTVPPPPSGAAPASARDQQIGSVEEALAILAKHKKEKKERKEKKAKKSKKSSKKERKERKEKKGKRSRRDLSDSSSDSES